MRARLIALALLCAPGPALAAPCNTPELVATLPPEGAANVATDATLVAAYASSAEYLGEEVLLIPTGGDPRPVPATFDRAQGLLSIKPADGLMPGTSYAVRWPALRGVDTATPGIGREIRFTTGTGPDLESPQFDGVAAVTWDLERERNNCTDDVEDRFAFELELAPAADNRGRESLALVVFQTAGPQVDAPVQVLVRPMPATPTALVTLPTSRSVGHICFAALARDLTGKVSPSAQREACVEATAPPFFRGCAVGGGSAGDGGPWWLIAAAAGAVLGRARRRGRRGD